MQMSQLVVCGVLFVFLGSAHAFNLGVRRGLLRGQDSQQNAQSETEISKQLENEISSSRYALEAHLVRGLVSGRSSLSHAVKKGIDTMSTQEALLRLDGKLPPEVASLVKFATKSGKSTADGAFTEVSLAKARNILNVMIQNSWVELDDKVIECKEFEERNRGTYDQVVNDMTRLASQIAALEKEMASANNGIEEADAGRSTTETQLEKLRTDYEAINMVNRAEMTKRKSDLAVFDFILNMTRCKDSVLLQVKTANPKSTGAVICDTHSGLELHFEDSAAQGKLWAMMTPSARKSIDEALNSVYSGPALLQLRATPSFFSNVSTVAGPPTALPVTLPVNAAPDPQGQWKKCTQDPNCGLLHDTMSLQWGKFKDAVDELQHDMTVNLDEYLKAKANLNAILTMYTAQKAAAMVALADATSKRDADIGESKDKLEQKHELQFEYDKKMKECDAKINEILFTNICAVRSVRNEVMEFSSVTPPSKISDCDVKDWVPGECTVPCDDACPNDDPYACGGWQMLTRAIVVASNTYGIQCPALARKKKCNQIKCPVDCVMSLWSGWGKCSKDCEGGIESQTRAVYVRPKNGGAMCDTVQESRSCNTGSCDRDCKLYQWAEWSPCSMACSGGIQERVRKVEIPIRGEGRCPSHKSAERFEDQFCNEHNCQGDEICVAVQDLIIMLDGSGSLRVTGFNTLREFTANLTDKYQGMWLSNAAMQVGVVLFGNGHLQTDGTVSSAITVTGLTNDTKKVREDVEALKWQRGFTNLAQGFVLADTLLSQGGRPDGISAVMVIWDGKYSFKFETAQKARMLKDKNVQIYMAVIAETLGQDETDAIHHWTSHPWQTNYEHIPGLLEAETAQAIYLQKVLVKFCPAAYSPSLQLKIDDTAGYTMIKEHGYPNGACGGGDIWLGEPSSLDNCASMARDRGDIPVFDYGEDAMGNTCYGHAQFGDFSLAQYNSWERDKNNIQCPGGGWNMNARYTSYAFEPVSGVF